MTVASRRCAANIFVLLTAVSSAQSATDRCQAFLTQMSTALQTPGVPSGCSQLETMRSVCNQSTFASGTGDIVANGYKSICEAKQQEAGDNQRREAERARRRQAAPETTRRPAQRSSDDQRTVQPPSAATLQSNRERILQALPVLLKQSLSRNKLTEAQLSALVDLGKQLGEAYFEKREGSVLAYTSKKDDAVADSRGYRKRESADFVVYYRTGDMVRAETTLRDAEASIAPIKAILHHFPSVTEHHGRKLPIYLANTPAAYISLSQCSERSIACVTHQVFDDGDIQTMYVSPASYQEGTKAAERVAAFRRTVQHELTHYAQYDMITARTIGMPRWIVEGLASYVAGEQERMSSLQADARNGTALFSFENLQRADGNIYDSANVLLYYSEGYSIFDMLVSTQGLDKTTALILDVTQTEDFPHALGNVLGLTVDNFDQQWRSFEQSKYGIEIPMSSSLSRELPSNPARYSNSVETNSSLTSQTATLPPVATDGPSLEETIRFMRRQIILNSPIVTRAVMSDPSYPRPKDVEASYTWKSFDLQACSYSKAAENLINEYDSLTHKLVRYSESKNSQTKMESFSNLKPTSMVVIETGVLLKDHLKPRSGLSIQIDLPIFAVAFQNPASGESCEPKVGQPRDFNNYPQDWNCKTYTYTQTNIFFESEDRNLAERFSKALAHAIRLCGGKDEAF